MHRIIMERVLGRPIHKGYQIDHINGNSFDNRRANLREVTPQQNIFNRKRKSTAQGSRYKGVGPKGDKWIAAIGYQGKNLRWIARIEVDGKCVSLGGFSNPEEAARAYDRVAIEEHGSKAITNFPLSDYEGGK